MSVAIYDTQVQQLKPITIFHKSQVYIHSQE